jgi:hypothetical protein
MENIKMIKQLKLWCSKFIDKPIELGGGYSNERVGSVYIPIELIDQPLEISLSAEAVKYELSTRAGKFQFQGHVKRDNKVLYRMIHLQTGKTMVFDQETFQIFFKKV